MSVRNDAAEHPQNPYQSFLVQASAGSGKTFQLSKRYMHLIASGAQPSSILTITFTVRAAAEMRSRIISEAGALLVNREEQRDFDRQMSFFFQQASELPGFSGKRLPEPMTAGQAATRVLANTQLLKITTIDSLFREWTSRFPFESSAEQSGAYHLQMSPTVTLCDGMDLQDLEARAWQTLFVSPDAKEKLSLLWQVLSRHGWIWTPLQLKTLLQELFRLHTFIWYCGHKQSGISPLRLYQDASGLLQSSSSVVPDSRSILHALQKELLTIAGTSKHVAPMTEAILAGDLSGLIRLKLLTKDLKIHGGSIRGKKRESLSSEINCVEDQLQRWSDLKKLFCLNEIGQALFPVYEAWIIEREKIKKQSDRSEFSDLTIGSFQLFHHNKGEGAVWQIQQSIRHLIFDEFQDTSLVQWAVFERLTREMLSGEGGSSVEGLPATTFIVGDDKQSVYGFREADPFVMTLARRCLEDYEKTSLPLNLSYRTSPLILNFVNRLFSGMISDFPEHKTAKNSDGYDFIPDKSRLRVFDWAEKSDEDSGVTVESIRIASCLKSILSSDHRREYPVFDKKTGGFREIRNKDCCILYRSATHAHEFEKALRQVGIPYIREEKKGFFERPEIKDMISFLSYLMDPTDDVSLLSLAQSPVFSGLNFSFSDLISDLSETYENRDERRSAALTALPDIWQQASGIDVAHLRAECRTLLPHQILTKIFMMLRIPALYEHCFKGSEGLIARRNLIRMIGLCSSLENEGYVTLTSCLQRMTELSSLDELASSSGDENVVRLMTIHKAKGLEFPLVMIVGAGEPWYRDDRYWLPSRGDQPGIYFAGTRELRPGEDPGFHQIVDGQSRALYEETIRLLYVAVTRASQYLMISGHRPFRKTSGSFLERSLSVIREMGAEASAAGDSFDLSGFLFSEGACAQDMSAQESGASGEEADVVWAFRKPVQGYSVPVETSVILPHAGEREEKLSEYPATRNGSGRTESRAVARIMGTYIHRCLELTIKGKAFDPELEWKILTESETLLSRDPCWRADHLRHFRSCQEEVRSVISSSLWQKLLYASVSAEAEQAVLCLKGRAFIRGQVDLVIHYPGRILLVDYKTGRLPFSEEDLADEGKRLELLSGFCHDQGHLAQMRLYSESFYRIFRSIKVSAAVLFTRGPWLIPVSSESYRPGSHP